MYAVCSFRAKPKHPERSEPGRPAGRLHSKQREVQLALFMSSGIGTGDDANWTDA